MHFEFLIHIYSGRITCICLPFIAKSYSACRDSSEIKFHLVNNLNELFLSHSVAPHRPEHICTSGPSTLIYLYCVTENQRRVRWLNCSTLSPQPTNISCEIRVKPHFGIHDVCCMQHDNEQLVVTTHGHKGVSAYSTNTKKLCWHVEGKGVAADGLGCLFVMNTVNVFGCCLQMGCTLGQCRYQNGMVYHGDFAGQASPRHCLLFALKRGTITYANSVSRKVLKIRNIRHFLKFNTRYV